MLRRSAVFFFVLLLLSSASLFAANQHSLHASTSQQLHAALQSDDEASNEASSNETPLWLSVAHFIVWICIPWIGGMVVLFLAGFILSSAALRAVSKSNEGSGAPIGLSASLRSLYSIVLGTATVYYYLSIPIVILLTIAVFGGVVAGFWAAGWLPIKIIIIAVVVGGVSVISMLRGLFVSESTDDPGLRLELGRHPKFRDLLNGVARKIGTPPVDNVYLTPGTDVGVTERKSGRFAGRAERCLILGVGALEGFKIRPFKAVLGHEYGHLTNKDTSAGRTALAARVRMYKTLVHVAQGGAAAWYNPAWHFLNLYFKLFLRISQGASRLQEAMADRWASAAYGWLAFEKGLRHVITREVMFSSHANLTLKEVVEGHKALVNLYAYEPSQKEHPSALDARLREQLNRETSAYDSHPAFNERISWLKVLNHKGEAVSEMDDQDVWSLFADRSEVEQRLTEIIRKNVRVNTGVEIEGGR